MNNFFIIVLDGVGVGELPDSNLYGDEGSNTLGNISRALNGISLPNLQKMGLGNIIPVIGVDRTEIPKASFGKLAEISKGKDSTTGHWEISGLYVDTDFNYYPDGFPDDIMQKFLEVTKCKGYLGNIAASGTEIIKQLGEEHLKTGFPIIYTSADSVFQIAAHQEVIPLDELYHICELTRNIVLADPIKIGRVIARPFTGTTGNFTRTVYRKDYSLSPPSDTVLDVLYKNDINTVSIGKISDLFNYRGINHYIKTFSNEEGCKELLKASKEFVNSLIFINLVDFDVYFGHRNDVAGFASALKNFDDFLPEFLNSLDETDRVIITADHGNDPTTPSTDHSREYVPLLYYGINKAVNDLGTRETFSDIGKTAADFFGITNELKGKSFLHE
ncbi:MAG: phosphopentomutase [Ignavibacteriota bacterium]|nr:phosphopentomutase [Ignavibacteriota bacterium]MBW7842324.1 phosphopentomutase [Ignavibacterium sp.]MCO6447016.1 phosphopentomutase [Ignavibacterium album]QKJ98431.1 MAG: phosphopentomutase [Ignavibacteriota bacterium]HOJ07699.1 phosphopentomutase [Ignavibacteriaceae bacterium]